MQEVSDQIKKSLLKAVSVVARIEAPAIEKIHLEHPTDASHGDYSSNIAMVLFKEMKNNAASDFKKPRNILKTPHDLALAIMSELQKDKVISESVEKIEAVKPGFINFYLQKSYFLKILSEIMSERDKFGSAKRTSKRKILVEYSSPNIAKQFSVGHLRSTIIGQAIYNLYKFIGCEVVGDNHLGDWGTQFGMIIAAVLEKGLDIKDLTLNDLEKLYVDFNKKLETDPDLRKKATDAFVSLEKGDIKCREIWKAAVDTSLAEFDKFYKLLGVKIDYAYGESIYEKMMPGIVKLLIDERIAQKSEGAYVIKYNDMPPAMLIKSDGGTTYLTRDLATIKFRRESPHLHSDIYVYEVGAEQKLHFRQVFRTAEMLGLGKESDYVHIAHGFLRLPEGKMSTRKGNTIKLRELLEKSIIKAEKILLDKSGTEKDAKRAVFSDSAKKIGIGAVKYNELKHSPSTDYIFNWEEALNMNGDSGSYLQYTAVRIRNLLMKAGAKDNMTFNFVQVFSELSLTNEELDIVKILSKFREKVEEAAFRFSPNLICSYLFLLAQKYNTFYNSTSIVPMRDTSYRMFRLNLSFSVMQVITNGLSILGIEIPESM